MVDHAATRRFFLKSSAVGLAAVGLAYIGCTVAVGTQPNTSGDFQPNRSPPDRNGIVNRPMSPRFPGEFDTEPPNL